MAAAYELELERLKLDPEIAGNDDAIRIIDAEIARRRMAERQEMFQTAQGQTQATAPGRIGQQVAFQPRTMVNPANLPGLGGSLLQMSPPFDPSVRRQLQQGNRKREDELFGTRMFFT